MNSSKPARGPVRLRVIPGRLRNAPVVRPPGIERAHPRSTKDLAEARGGPRDERIYCCQKATGGARAAMVGHRPGDRRTARPAGLGRRQRARHDRADQDQPQPLRSAAATARPVNHQGDAHGPPARAIRRRQTVGPRRPVALGCRRHRAAGP